MRIWVNWGHAIAYRALTNGSKQTECLWLALNRFHLPMTGLLDRFGPKSSNTFILWLKLKPTALGTGLRSHSIHFYRFRESRLNLANFAFLRTLESDPSA